MRHNKKSGPAALGHLAAALRERRWLLPAACYLLAFAGALTASCVSLAVDSWHRGTGRLAQRELTVADFTLVNAVAEGSTVTSTNEDPQLLYGPTDIRLDTLTVQLTYDKAPFERCLYYTTRPGEAFGQDKRVWPVENADGTVTYTLPAGALTLRLDPGSRTDLVMEFGAITLNAQRSAASYFVPSGGVWFALLALPGLAAAIVQWAGDMIRKK